MIVVQEIRTEWSKFSRRGLNARVRNATPEEAVLGPCSDAQAMYARVLILYAEPTFEPQYDWRSYERLPHGDRHLLFEDDNPAHGLWREYATEAAMPARAPIELPLPVDRWTQIRFNSRLLHSHHGEFSDWRWHQTVLNIGRFSRWPDSDIFMGQPGRVVDRTVMHTQRSPTS